jgi:hypothetical protein
MFGNILIYKEKLPQNARLSVGEEAGGLVALPCGDRGLGVTGGEGERFGILRLPAKSRGKRRLGPFFTEKKLFFAVVLPCN